MASAQAIALDSVITAGFFGGDDETMMESFECSGSVEIVYIGVDGNAKCNTPPSLSSSSPTSSPSSSPTSSPTSSPSSSPTSISQAPSNGPSKEPSYVPSDTPSDVPSQAPSDVPSKELSYVPSETPSDVPSQAPTDVPTIVPVVEPTHRPTDVPRTCWTYQEGYMDSYTFKHCPSELWADVAEAKAACLADPTCFGIHKYKHKCGGKYRKTKKDAIWKFYSNWETQDIWSYRLDLPCSPTDPCWTYLEGYLDNSSFKHCPSAAWDDLAEAQAACVADLECFGIHKLKNKCGGKYRKTKKNVSWIYHSNWKSSDKWAYRLDDRTCAAANSRRLNLSPPSTSPRQLNSQEKEQSAAVGVAVVASKNSASFATTIKLSTMVKKDSGTAIPSHRGTVMTITFSLLLALVSHFLCL